MFLFGFSHGTDIQLHLYYFLNVTHSERNKNTEKVTVSSKCVPDFENKSNKLFLIKSCLAII